MRESEGVRECGREGERERGRKREKKRGREGERERGRRIASPGREKGKVKTRRWLEFEVVVCKMVAEEGMQCAYECVVVYMCTCAHV